MAQSPKDLPWIQPQTGERPRLTTGSTAEASLQRGRGGRRDAEDDTRDRGSGNLGHVYCAVDRLFGMGNDLALDSQRAFVEQRVRAAEPARRPATTGQSWAAPQSNPEEKPEAPPESHHVEKPGSEGRARWLHVVFSDRAFRANLQAMRPCALRTGRVRPRIGLYARSGQRGPHDAVRAPCRGAGTYYWPGCSTAALSAKTRFMTWNTAVLSTIAPSQP